MEFSNRELIQRAMPLTSLSSSQWDFICDYLDKIAFSEGEDSLVYKTIEILLSNQAKLEVIGKFNLYYKDEPVSKENITGIDVA